MFILANKEMLEKFEVESSLRKFADCPRGVRTPSKMTCLDVDAPKKGFGQAGGEEMCFFSESLRSDPIA